MGDLRSRVGCPKPQRLIVIDKKTKLYFLVAPDSNVSFFPKSKKQRKSRDHVEFGTSELLLNNFGAIIQTYGKIDCVLDIGLGKKFSWTFNLSNFERPIIGRDFLTHYGLMLNFKNMTLFNPVTNCETTKMTILPCECHQKPNCEDGWPSITGIYTKPIKQRFFVYEKFSNLPFLIGNTSQLCIFPISCLSAENKLEPVNDTLEIVGDLNRKSKVLGFTSLTLDFGTNRKFVWKFFVVDDYKPIIGLDFMNHFGLVRKFQRGRYYLADLRTKWSIPCDTTIDATGWPSTVTVNYKPKSVEVPLKVHDNVEKFNFKTSRGDQKSGEASTSQENPQKESRAPRAKREKKKFAKTTRNDENAVSRPRNSAEESNSRITHRFHVTDYNSKLQYLVSNVQISMFPKNYVDNRDLSASGNLTEIRGAYGQFLKVLGWTTKTLDLGLGRAYSFRFAVVDIEKPILGNDFIRHFDFSKSLNSLLDRKTGKVTPPPSEPCDCRRFVTGWPDVQIPRPRFPSWRGRAYQNFRRYPRRNYSETRAAPQTRMRSSTPVDGESGKNSSSEINTPQLSANFSSDNLESSSLRNESEMSIKIMNKSADDSEAELETNFNKESRILESIISEESPVIVLEPKTEQVIIPTDRSKEPKKILVKEATSEEDSAISVEKNLKIVLKEQTTSKEDAISIEENIQIVIKEQTTSEEEAISIEENIQIVVKEQTTSEEEAISIEVTETIQAELQQEIIDSKISNAEEVKITQHSESKEENSVEKMDTAEDVFESSSDSDLEVIHELPEAIDEKLNETSAKDSKIEKSTEMELSSDSKENEDSANRIEIQFCELKIEDIKNDNSTEELQVHQEHQELQEEKDEVNQNSTVDEVKESTEILDNEFSIINIEKNSTSEEKTENSKEDSKKCDNSSKELESEEDFKDCSEEFEEETRKEKIDESEDNEESSSDDSSEAKTAIKVDEDESSDDTSEGEVSLEEETSEDDEDEKVDSKLITDDTKELIEEEAKKMDDSSATDTDSETDSTDTDSQKLVIDIETSRTGAKKHFHVMDKSSKILFFITEKSQESSFPISMIQGDSMKDSEKTEFIVADSSIFPILGSITLKLDFGLDREYEWTFAVTDFVKPIIANDFLNHFRLECDYTLEYPRISDLVTTKITEQFTDDCDCEDFALLLNIQKIDSIPVSMMNEKKIAIELCKTPNECSKEKGLILVDQDSGLPCLISEFDISVYPKLYVGEDEKIEKFDDSVKIFNGDVEIPIYGWIVRIIDFQLGRYFLWKFLVVDIKAPIIGKDFMSHYDFDVLLEEKIVFDNATKKSVESSEEFYECQTKKYWPDNFRVEKMEKSLSDDEDSDDSEIGIEETEI